MSKPAHDVSRRPHAGFSGDDQSRSDKQPNIMTTGACGAFVSTLEDEFMGKSVKMIEFSIGYANTGCGYLSFLL